MTDGEKNKDDSADLLRYREQMVEKTALGDKGKRGAKVVQRDWRMSDSEEHLRINMHVCVMSFTTV